MIIVASIVVGVFAGWLLSACLLSDPRGLWRGVLNAFIKGSLRRGHWWDPGYLEDEERMPWDKELDADGWKLLLIFVLSLLCVILTYLGLHRLFG